MGFSEDVYDHGCEDFQVHCFKCKLCRLVVILTHLFAGFEVAKEEHSQFSELFFVVIRSNNVKNEFDLLDGVLLSCAVYVSLLGELLHLPFLFDVLGIPLGVADKLVFTMVSVLFSIPVLLVLVTGYLESKLSSFLEMRIQTLRQDLLVLKVERLTNSEVPNFVFEHIQADWFVFGSGFLHLLNDFLEIFDFPFMVINVLIEAFAYLRLDLYLGLRFGSFLNGLGNNDWSCYERLAWHKDWCSSVEFLLLWLGGEGSWCHLNLRSHWGGSDLII